MPPPLAQLTTDARAWLRRVGRPGSGGVPLRPRDVALEAAIAAGATALAWLVRWLLHPLLDASQPFSTFYLAVLGVAWRGHTAAAVLVGLAGFPLASPAFGPAGEHALDPGPFLVATGLTYYAVVFTCLGLVVAVRRSERRARERGDALEREMQQRATLARDVERRRAREEAGRALLGLANVLVRDAQARITLWSAGAAELYGYTEAEALGRVSYELLRTEFPRPLEEIGAELARTGHWAGEVVHYTKEGRRLSISCSWTLHEARERRIVEVNHDVTQLRVAREHLRHSEVQLRLIADSLPEIVFISAPDGRHTFVNRRFYELTAAPPGSAEGFGFLAWFHPEDSEAAVQRLTASLESGTPLSIDYRLRLADGSYRWFHGSSRPVRDERGGIVRWFGICTEIDERKRLEDALRDSEARQRMLVDTAKDYAIIGLDADGRIVSWSDGAHRLFGHAAADVTGRHVAVLFTPEDVAAGAPAQELATARRTGRAEDTRWQSRADGSRFFADGSVHPIRGDDGLTVRGFVKIMRDMTLQRLAEAERERLLEATEAARAEAERANRAKDEFLAVLSHELRSPLNAMMGWLHILKRAPGTDGLQATGLDTLERNVRMQAQVIDELLDVSRIVTGKLELEHGVVDVGDLACRAVDSIRPVAEAKGVRVECHAPAGPIAAGGDAKRLGQVLGNLLGNAVKFTPAGGVVRVVAERAGSVAQLLVEDMGEGIAPDVLPFVFDRFRQADSSDVRRHGGLGLGLSIVKHLVERHGGTVSAHSEGRGRGARFVVRLPLLHEPVESTRGGSEPHTRDRPILDGVRVLLVEDDTDTRMALTIATRLAGADVVHAGSVAEGRQLLDAAHPDVVVSDIGMPDESGYALIRDVRAHDAALGRRTLAIALTGYATFEDRRTALAAGFDAHIAKPLDPATLVSRVRDLLAGA